MKILKTLTTLQGVKEINRLQKGTKKHSANPGVQPPHNPCSCLWNDQPGMSPVNGTRNCPISTIPVFFYMTILINLIKKAYITGIMDDCKVCTWKLWFDESLVIFKSCIQFLRKCLMCWSGKHTVHINIVNFVRHKMSDFSSNNIESY